MLKSSNRANIPALLYHMPPELYVTIEIWHVVRFVKESRNKNK
jgi:hypothetical protein